MPYCSGCGTRIPAGDICDDCQAGAPPAAVRQSLELNAVTIRGIDIPFGDLVVLIIKLTLASIPAAILLALLAGIVSIFFAGFLTALLGM